jgi:hypothetical protein
MQEPKLGGKKNLAYSGTMTIFLVDLLRDFLLWD